MTRERSVSSGSTFTDFPRPVSPKRIPPNVAASPSSWAARAADVSFAMCVVPPRARQSQRGAPNARGVRAPARRSRGLGELLDRFSRKHAAARACLAAAGSDRKKSGRLLLLRFALRAGLVLVAHLRLGGHLDLARLAAARVEARAHLVAFLDLLQASLASVTGDRGALGDLQLLLAAGGGRDLQGSLVLVDLLDHAGELGARACAGARRARRGLARRGLARARGRLARRATRARGRLGRRALARGRRRLGRRALARGRRRLVGTGSLLLCSRGRNPDQSGRGHADEKCLHLSFSLGKHT